MARDLREVAVESWSVGRDGRPGKDLWDVLAAAIAAPSVHNTQPWRFRIRDGVVEVLADRDRRLAVLDPTGRELMISVGAAIMNLRLAILARGHVPVLRMLPDPAQPDLAARIEVGRQVAAPPVALLLAQAIPYRHTNRRAFWVAAVPGRVREDLAAASRAEGAQLAFAHPVVRQAVLSVVRTADVRWRGDAAYRAELAEWTRGRRDYPDGVPPETFGSWDALEVVPVRDFGLIEPVADRWAEPFEDEPLISVLYTAGDSPYDWLRAGQALERTLLTATAHDVSTTLMTQPLEIPELRALLADQAAGRVAQAIVRFGYGPPAARSPRRPVEETLYAPA